MLAYAGGDVIAFEALYRRHRARLYRFLLRSLQHPADADELFQETWSRLIRARARYRPDARFGTWLLQIAHNLARDHFRRRGTWGNGDDAQATLEALAAPASEEPDHLLSEFERRRRLQLALEDLPDEQRTTFLLRVESGLGLEEIAEVTGVGRETTKSRLRYALARIRARLST